MQPEESRVRAVEYVDPSVADPAQSPLPDGVRRTVTAYFETEPPSELDRDTLFVTLASGRYAIALAQVDRVEVKRPDNAKNINIVLATLFAAILVGVTLSDPDAWDWAYRAANGGACLGRSIQDNASRSR